LQGLFGVHELRTAEGFYLLQQQAEVATERLIKETGDPKRSRKMVEVFDEMSDTLCQVADLAEFIRVAHPRSSYAQAAEDACVAVSSIVEKYVFLAFFFFLFHLSFFRLELDSQTAMACSQRLRSYKFLKNPFNAMQWEDTHKNISTNKLHRLNRIQLFVLLFCEQINKL
jgi:hypothetical protein